MVGAKEFIKVHSNAKTSGSCWCQNLRKCMIMKRMFPEVRSRTGTMSKEGERRTAMPPNFYKEVYNALSEWYSKGRLADPGELDTSGPLRHTGTHILVQVLPLQSAFL